MEQQSTNINATNGNTQSQNVANVANKIPLFDYYSCRLTVLPTSSFI
jgi:hypothetical protein